MPPVASSAVSRHYAQYAPDSGKYHAGMDIVPAATAPNERYAVSVRAVRAGVVRRILGLRRPGNNLRRYDPAADAYRWETPPGPAHDQPGGDNHGLGICVIVYHPDVRLHSLYAHLDAVVTGLVPGQQIDAGATIGRMGNSHGEHLRHCPVNESCPPPAESSAPPGAVTADADGFPPHLHLEVKDRAVLGARRTDDEGPDWGETAGSVTTNMPGHPNWFGYHDPDIFLRETVETLASPTPVEVLVSGLSVRHYPSTDGRHSVTITRIGGRKDGNRPAFVANRRVGSAWYQVFLPNLDGDGWSASGWIAGSVNRSQYSQPNTALPQVRVLEERAAVYSAPSADSSPLAFVYGGELPDPQRFVPFGGSAGWHRIHLPENAAQPEGWVWAGN